MEEVSQNSFVFKLVDRQMTFFCLGKASSPSKKPYARLLHPLILIYWLVQNEFPFFVVRIPVAHPPSVSPPTAVNHAGTSDWSRCPSPGRSSPLWHFVQLKLPAVTAALGGLIESMCFLLHQFDRIETYIDFERSTRATMRPWMALQFPLEATRRLTFSHKIIYISHEDLCGWYSLPPKNATILTCNNV